MSKDEYALLPHTRPRIEVNEPMWVAFLANPDLRLFYGTLSIFAALPKIQSKSIDDVFILYNITWYLQLFKKE